MQTRNSLTLTAAGLVLRALGIAEHARPEDWVARALVHEHMRDAMTDLELQGVS